MGAEWAIEEMRYLQLKDKRLNQRTQRVIGMLSERPAKTVPEASGDWMMTKSVYRLWDNEQVDEAAIRRAHYQATRDRVAGKKRILAIQDTTELNYTGKNVAEKLGYLSNSHAQGLLMHSVLAVSETGVPLGLLHQHLWTREMDRKGKTQERRKKETAEKESQRWLAAVTATEELLPETVEIVHIADREGDIYALFALPRRAGSQVLIRMGQNRLVEHAARYLWDAIRQAPLAGERLVQVTQQANREPRLATVQVRFATLTVRPPHEQSGPGIALQFILAEEQSAPPEAEPIVWLLATSLPVTRFAEAELCLDYYTQRWLIERFHFVLKSGCKIEQLYLQTPERLYRALATYSVVAWRLLWLTYEARQTPDQPCDTVLQTHEWQALYCTIHHTSTPPSTPPTLKQAVRWIARLGGFLGRTHDGDPGSKTIWRGLQRLDDIAATWLLLNPHSPA